MQHQDCFAVVDCTFRDLLKVDQLFGGIPVGALKSGLCPNPPQVVPNGSKAATVLASIRNWIMWPHLTQPHLTENLCLRGVMRTYVAYLSQLS
jgi:PIF1-like helicase